MNKLILPVAVLAGATVLTACTRNVYNVTVTPRPTPKPTVTKPASQQAPVRKAPANVAANLGDGFQAVTKPTTYSNP